jgi:hypothetical protein
MGNFYFYFQVIISAFVFLKLYDTFKNLLMEDIFKKSPIMESGYPENINIKQIEKAESYGVFESFLNFDADELINREANPSVNELLKIQDEQNESEKVENGILSPENMQSRLRIFARRQPALAALGASGLTAVGTSCLRVSF